MSKKFDIGEATAEEIRQFFATAGMKGGKATGKSKVRGDKAYYQRISKKAAKARKAKADRG